MRLTNRLSATVAIAALALLVPAAATLTLTPVATAQAANVDVSFNLFYDGLASDGDWVSLDGDYVFVPANTRPGWRPYTEGHWIYAKKYGWTWVSDEPFGWATYHYGRWGYTEDIGWYWEPGTRWAPAWVSWRRGKDHVAWAPLPPRRGKGKANVEVNIDISNDDIPESYWVAVPAPEFLADDLEVVIIADDGERRRVVRESEYIGVPRVENNIVINTVIDIDFIRDRSKKEVREVEIKEATEPVARQQDGEVTVFTGTLEPAKDAKPPKVTEIEDVKKKQVKERQQTGETPPAATDVPADQAAKPLTPEQPADAAAKTGEPVTTGDDAAKAPADPAKSTTEEAATPAKPKASSDEDPAKAEAAKPVTPDDQAATPAKPKVKAKAAEEPAADQAETPAKPKQKSAEETKEKADTPAKTKKKPAEQAKEESAEPVTTEEKAETAKPKKEPAGQAKKPAAEPEAEAEDQAAEKPAAKPKKQAAEPAEQETAKKKDDKACDPNTNPDCPVQQ